MTLYNIERYLNVQVAYNATFNGAGDQLVFLTNITGIPQVWKVMLDSAGRILWPTQLTFEENRVSFASASPRAGDYRIVYGRDVGGNENVQFFLLDTETSAESCLTESHEDTMHMFGSWSPDGQSIAYSANRRNKGLFDLYIQPLDGEARLVWENNTPGYLFGARFSPDSKRLLVAHMMGSFDTDLYEVDIDSGEARLLSPNTEGVRYFMSTYAPDGQSAFTIDDKDTDFLHISRLDLQTLDMETLIAPDWDVSEIKLSHDRRSLAYTVNVDGSSELYLHNLESGAVQQASLGTIPGVASELEFSPDDSRLLFTFNRAAHTADVFIWDFATDGLQKATQSSHAGLPPDTFVVPELVHYPTFDKDESGQTRRIPAWLFKPQQAAGKPLPVVVLVHGGPEGQSQPSFNGLIQFFVNNGYAVLQPNVRGSVGYGKAYSHLDDVRKRMDSVADLAHGAYWLKEQPDFNSDSIALYGGSYGGFMVLSALTTYPDLWAAGVNIVGISNFVTFLENTSDYRRKHREAEYGSLEHDREFLESISPINHIDEISAPLLVIHGANDPRVPVGEAEQLVEALRERDIPTELLVFDDEGHGLVKLSNRLVAYRRVVAFLAEYRG